ncbi:MAG: 2-Phospho-l-lactate Guanylyltransferase,CofC [Myxococcales bacterium]|nr:2-Phospho-l-lactate Guanylyltransferase,CofC [Myxococcales bacterium]
MMGTWALVPQKDFARGKSRLSATLSDEARASFARGLFDHVLLTLRQSGALDGILVVTDSLVVEEAARAHGAEVQRDGAGASTLAQVIDAGLAGLARRGAGAGLVLMADLPRLSPEDVRALLASAAGHDLLIVRAGDGTHTNALWVSPPDRLPTAFGRADSFAAHVAAGRAAGLRLVVVDNPRVAFDVDGPDDHAALLGALRPS